MQVISSVNGTGDRRTGRPSTGGEPSAASAICVSVSSGPPGGRLKKARSLQKLMLRSYANTLVSVRRVTQINAGRNTPGVDKVVVKTPAARGKLGRPLACLPALARQARSDGCTYRKPTATYDHSEYRPCWTAAYKLAVKNALEPAGKPALRAPATDFDRDAAAMMPLQN